MADFWVKGMSNGGPFTVCAGNSAAAYAPFPAFSPTAVRFSFEFKPTSPGALDVEERDFFWLRTKETNHGLATATGLSPLTTFYNNSACTTAVPRYLGFNRSAEVGLDPGAFTVLKNKQYFLIGEGYYPSLVLTDTSGLIRARFVPTVYNTTSNSAACLTPLLPAIFSYIRRTKDIGGSGGFSGVALTNSETVAWAILRRPLGSDDANSNTRNARVHRVVRLDLSDPLNPKVTGTFLYETTPLAQWQAKDASTTATDIKVTALVPLTDDKFLVLERGKSNSIVYEVDFSAASNVLSDAQANYQANLILETRSHFNQTLNYKLPQKRKLVDLSEVRGINAAIQTEGLTVLSDSVLGFAESNRWTGPTRFRVHAVWLAERLPLPQTPSVEAPAGPFSGPRAILDQTLAHLTDASADGPSLYAIHSAREQKHYEVETAAAHKTMETVPNHVKLNFNFGNMVARAN
eukprot:TRINITY_DN150_c0_g1_i12.p1 TRINITY_DN150_c0_g1~~TRINITY_DN150_c0_g1_i12.p1  ORF type:complete len:462 (+),score=120.15 TRINITY_DN150_c0_g1_i12:529-1914(+)